ncbi:integrase, catalytic region, zinc finger, CCHC-type containing protein [Tanacetum coccineum]
MTTLAEHIIIAGAENHPLMLYKSMYDSWGSRIRLFIMGKKHGRIMLDSINNGPLVYPRVKENGHTRLKKYSKLTEAQQLQDDCDVQATNIILLGLPPDVLYNLFDKVAYVQGETLYEYYWRFSQLINDMHTIGMTMQQVQVNTKFLNALPSEWSKFVTDVKLAKSLYTTNYDQLYAYLSQHERHANDVRITRERYPDPLALVANSPTLYNPSQSLQHSGRQSQSFAGTRNREIARTSRGNYAAGQPKVVKCYNCQGKGHMARQCTQPKRPRNVAWFKEKFMLSKAQEVGLILDEEQLAFLADPGILEAPVALQTIP